MHIMECLLYVRASAVSMKFVGVPVGVGNSNPLATSIALTTKQKKHEI